MTLLDTTEPTLRTLDTMLKDLSTTKYYKAIEFDRDAEEYVLHYCKAWAIHGDMESDSVSYDTESWDMKVAHDDLVLDWIVYDSIKTMVDEGKVGEVIDTAFTENTIMQDVYLMSWETLSLVEDELNEMAKELREDDDNEQWLEMYGLVSRRLKEY